MDEISKGKKELTEISPAKLEELKKIMGEAIPKAFNNAANAFRALAASMKAAAEWWKEAANYPNKRVVHLAEYGKRLTRKKNAKRISRWIEQGR